MAAIKGNTARNVNGRKQAIKLLRRLESLNWDREKPANSASLVDDTLRTVTDLPATERKRFSRVISDWLVTEVLGCVDTISAYETRKAS